MNYSTYRRTLDLQKHQSNLSIAVFQYDSAVRLILSFTDGGKPYLIREGSQAVFYGKRSDQTPLCLPCIIPNDSEIIFEFNDTVTAVLGMVNCEVRLYGTEKELITAPRFTIWVEPRVVDSDDVEIVESTLEAVDKMFLDEIERTNNEAAREANELQRIANEEAREKKIAELENAKGDTISSTEEKTQTMMGELNLPKVSATTVVADVVNVSTANAFDVHAMNNMYAEGSISADGSITAYSEVKGGTAKITGQAEVGSLKSNGAVSGKSASFTSITASNGAALDGQILIGDSNENSHIDAYCSASFGDTEVRGNLSVQSNALVEGDLHLSGDLYSYGTITSIARENLTVSDNIVVVNSDGTVLGQSGLVINTGEWIDSNQYVAYGILYGSTGDAVYIGKGVLEYAEDGYDMSATFTFDKGEAVPLAARSGYFEDGDLAMWDTSTNTFVPSHAIGDIGAALDELHSYAQALINGGAS